MGAYDALKVLAQQKRREHRITTATVGLQVIRQVYRAEGITVDLWKLSPRIRAVYMCDDGDPSVLVNKALPREPRLFCMAHELKHHFCDRELIASGQYQCGAYNANETAEIGAEVFAAEFIYPEAEFLACVGQLGIAAGKCMAEDVVRLKRACGAPVSFTFLRKRLEFFRFAAPGQLGKIHFQKLEEAMFGLPIYKQPWFRRRQQKQGSR